MPKSLSIKPKLQQIAYWPELKQIIHKIHQKGFQALIVGGAVRQALLNKKIEDVDLASSAHPEQLLKLFPKAKGIFKEYGIVVIPLKNKKNIEVTSFRKDSTASDGRRPQSIQYSGIKEDATRRDFTINALFYDLKTDQISDWFGGIKDLKNKTIKCIGKAEDRFKEDHLRILRALRLAHQLKFKIEAQTGQALMAQRHTVKKLAKERILKELNKMFRAGRLDLSLQLLQQKALWEILFPSLDVWPSKSSSSVKNGNQKIFLFYRQNFSFYHQEAFCWTALALPFFYKDKKSFQGFLNTYPLPTATRKQAVSYWQSVQTLIRPDSLFADKLIAFNHKAQPLYELTKALVESKILCDKNSKSQLNKPSQSSSKSGKPYQLENLHKTKSLSKPLFSLSKNKLDFYFKEFKKRTTNNQLAPALVTGRDLLNLKKPIKKQHFSQYLKQAYRLQIEKPSWSKSRILKDLTSML